VPGTVLELRDVWKVYEMGEVKVEALKGILSILKKENIL